MRKISIKPKVRSGVLRVLFIEDKKRGTWAAQCLEHDIAVQGQTYLEVDSEVRRVIACHLSMARRRKTDPFKGIPPAPKVFHDLHRTATVKFTPEMIPSAPTHYREVPPLQAAVVQAA